MAVKLTSSPHYPESTGPPFMCLRSRHMAMACPQSTSTPSRRRVPLQFGFFRRELPSSVRSTKSSKMVSPARSSVDGGGFSSSGNGPNGRTRLIKAIQDLQVKINARIADMRKGFPMKVFFFLVGFYCSTAFATVIGQTGDWDILSAGLAVVVVEGIGALMYKSSFPVLAKIRSLITVFNFWKAGLALGLFLDAFKYETDNVFGSWDHFSFEIDVFHIFL